MGNKAFDVRASADEVLELLRGGHGAAALARLETMRQGQPAVLQEALDRYVAGQEKAGLDALREQATPEQTRTLDRLDVSREAPRLPNAEPDTKGRTELTGLNTSQQHDVYASILYTRGNEAAKTALEQGDRVILGLRQENSTLASMKSAEKSNEAREDDPATPGNEARQGTGLYDDQMVVLWRSKEGEGNLHLEARVTTEPTAVYDHHAGSNGARVYAEAGGKVPKAEASPGFEDVRRPRKVEGADADGDGIRDLGRLREGTYEMEVTTHEFGGVDEPAFRPTVQAVRNGKGMVERDTNGDGLFDSRDVNGVQDLNRTYKIHPGSQSATDSAGCQTVQGLSSYRQFYRAADPEGGHQRKWQYVLTSVKPTDYAPLVNGDSERKTETGAEREPAAPVSVPSVPAVTPQQRDAIHRVYGQIGPTIQSNGYGMDEALRVCGACVAHEAKVGEEARFVVSKDGERVAALHGSGSIAEINVASALQKPTMEHLSVSSQPAKLAEGAEVSQTVVAQEPAVMQR